MATTGLSVVREAARVRFLQEQCAATTKALDSAEEQRDVARVELDRASQRVQRAEARRAELVQQLHRLEEQCAACEAQRSEVDEQVQVLIAQNRALSEEILRKEADNGKLDSTLEALTRSHAMLEDVAERHTRTRTANKQQLAAALAAASTQDGELEAARQETQQLQEAKQRIQQLAEADSAPLEEKLRNAKQQNIECLRQLQKNEVRESQQLHAIERLKTFRAELTFKRRDMEGQLEPRDSSPHQATQRGVLEETVRVLKRSLCNAEEQLGASRGGGDEGVHALGRLDDKVFALQEQLHQSQEALQRKEQSGSDKSTKLAALEVHSRELQQQYQPLVDERLRAEANARSTGQASALLLNTNRALEESLRLASTLQEQAEGRVRALREKEAALLNHNDFLAKRIDGNEEDKAAMRYELRRLEGESWAVTRRTGALQAEASQLRDTVSRTRAEAAEIASEVDRFRAEDMLDEHGRLRPIVLESESSLLEKLQINEFLLKAQVQRNPVPLLVEKISQLLGDLHRVQVEGDRFEDYVKDSHCIQASLRQKNAALDEKVELCEAWKRRALQKIVLNEFETERSSAGHKLCLDSLEYRNEDLEELCNVLRHHRKQDEVFDVSLQGSLLDASSVPVICEVLGLCHYLRLLDLRHNALPEASIRELAGFVQRTPGVSSCDLDAAAGTITAKSGAQVRLVVRVGDQRASAAPAHGESGRADCENEHEDEGEEVKDEVSSTVTASLDSPVASSRSELCSWSGFEAAQPLSPAMVRGGVGLAQSMRKLQQKLGVEPCELYAPSAASTQSLASTQLGGSSSSSWSSSSPSSDDGKWMSLSPNSTTRWSGVLSPNSGRAEQAPPPSPAERASRSVRTSGRTRLRNGTPGQGLPSPLSGSLRGEPLPHSGTLGRPQPPLQRPRSSQRETLPLDRRSHSSGGAQRAPLQRGSGQPRTRSTTSTLPRLTGTASAPKLSSGEHGADIEL